ncbi:MAG: alpha/beta hydrolase [Candidatus Paracaedibacteraceae bacterium]|nr:alpha/beta hydrolase [Candidatus Paracaedibacteraceae bacterium]
MSNICYVKSLSANLWTESFGNLSDPLIILISGAEKQGIYWSDSWCNTLANSGYLVVRFDNRDTGLSQHINFNHSPYYLHDMANDVLCIIKFYKKEKAHLIGSGMGGYLAQMIAINNPEKVSSLALLMTTYNAMDIEEIRINEYETFHKSSPGIFVKLERVSRMLVDDPKWLSKAISHLKLLNGPYAPFNEKEAEAFAYLLKKRINENNAPSFIHNHLLAKNQSNLFFKSNFITHNTLVIHGSDDPIISIQHAHTTAKIIPNSTLKIISKMGHLLTSFFEKEISDSVINHFKKI